MTPSTFSSASLTRSLVTSAVVAGGAGDDGEDWRDPAVNPYLLTGDELDRAANFVG